jgi:hypothetical protein
VYFFDLKNTRQWHGLVWTQASVCEGPMNEDGLHFARDVAKKRHRYFDDKLALAEFLERRHLSQGHTMAERRAALRLSRQQSTLGLDVHTAVSALELPAAQHVVALPATADDLDGSMFADDLDDDPVLGDGHFYDDVLEDV